MSSTPGASSGFGSTTSTSPAIYNGSTKICLDETDRPNLSKASVSQNKLKGIAMATTNKTEAKVFSFLNEQIRAGRGDLMVPGSETLSGCIKRDAEGGENKLHCHPTEDHTFYILEGQATFHIDSD